MGQAELRQFTGLLQILGFTAEKRVGFCVWLFVRGLVGSANQMPCQSNISPTLNRGNIDLGRSLGGEDPREKGMATHSSVLAWRIPWREEPGGLQSMGSQRVRHY